MLSIYRFLPAICVLAGAAVIAQPANANLIRYDISSTGTVNCTTSGGNSAQHGLWTNSVFASTGECGDYFNIQAGSYLDITEGTDTTGHLHGQASNPNGYTATFDIMLSGYLDTYAGYKQEGPVSYDPATDDPDIDFFTSAMGTISIVNDTNPITYNEIFNFSDFFGTGNNGLNAVFQYGTAGVGANSKDSAQGASAWITVTGAGVNGHWDFNLNSNRVPEPSTVSLFALGLVGIGVVARRRRPAETGSTT